jgi:hypothetical protein
MYNKMMFLGLIQVYYKNTNAINRIITTRRLKVNEIRLEVIYKRKQSTKQSRLGFSERQSILTKREHKHFILTSDRVSKG